MSKPAVKSAVDKGLRMAAASARTRTRGTSVLSTTSTQPHEGPPSVCPHHHQHPQPHTSSTASFSSSPSHCVLKTTTTTTTVSDEKSRTAMSTSTHPVTDTIKDMDMARVRSFEEMPGPRGLPLVGTLLEYFKKENRGRMHEIQRRNHQQYGAIFREPFGLRKNVCVADPCIIGEILRSEGLYPNRPPYDSWVIYNRLRDRRGGVMTSQGEYWKRSRRTLNPKLMKPQSAGQFIGGMNSTTQDFLTRIRHLKSSQPDGQSVQKLPLEINKYTMEAMCQVLLNVRFGMLDSDMSPKIQEFIEAIAKMFLTGHELMAFAEWHQYLGSPIWRQHEEAWDIIYSVANELMADQVDAASKRLEERGSTMSTDEMDVITYMVSTGTLTRNEIIDNLTETLMGGVDTVANGVSFMVYLLAKNESVQSKLREEVDSVLGKEPCQMDDLQAMPYVKAVVRETLRLFPPIPINARETQEDIVLSNYRIPKGTIILLNNYTMSRDERIFKDPSSFIPDRWLRAEAASWHPFSAIPFGYGVRSCVGRRVSENLMYIAAIQMVQNFILKKDPSYDIVPTVRTQFTPGPELPVLFVER